MGQELPIVSVLSIDAGALSFVKTVEVYVSFAKTDGLLQTLEGKVPYRVGDALLLGIQGEQWPVERNQFDEWYRPVEGKAGWYVKVKSVLATQLPYAFRVPVTADGLVFLTGKAGDWVVQTAIGHLSVVDKLIFAQSYRPSLWVRT
ncbi:hypothetical protein H8L32_15325 [Undibacterium sp. CY18W]|uniref:Uncharacterized protein n=1 Tax=Undibacterium hunanense TaxID=2762292 RepID=A0ABR6ZSL4_9BURK|nr:PGDYG domain-containing protein [Undibacterium hunanense]MBC3918861.1 hypothetical protein [Undibacterium hunanense]